MKLIFLNYISDLSQDFFKRYPFRKEKEITEGEYFLIEYTSTDFKIKIEKYRLEFYVIIYKIKESGDGINLFNLLQFLKQGTADIPSSNYFREEKDIDECYQKQLKYIFTVLSTNHSEISDFYHKNNYVENVKAFEKYWKNKHPELYKH